MNEIFDVLADGLAQNGFAIVDNFLTSEQVNDILLLDEFKSSTDVFKKAGIGKKQDRQINESIRGDYIHWINKNSPPAPTKVYLNKLNELLQFLNQSLFLSLKDYEVHMTIYPSGSFYKRHLDQFKADDHRKLSVICYLNENWTEAHGGQLRLYLSDRSLDILPLAGRLVCFRSDLIEHEVLPATKKRLSLTGWILDQLTDLRHL